MLTPEQLKARKEGIGGSDAAGVCGVSKWKTPVKVYLDKISDSIDQEENPVFERGHVLEPLVKAMFSCSTGLEVKETNHTIRRHDKHSFMLANIDGFIPEEKALLEIKTAHFSQRNEWGDVFTDQIPKDYLTQVHHYLNVCNMNKAYVVVMFGDESLYFLLMLLVKKCGIAELLKEITFLDLYIYEVHRNASFDKVLTDVERQFWFDHVQKKVSPSWTSVDDLKALFPKAETGKRVTATEEDVDIIRQIRNEEATFKSITKDHEEKIAALKSRLLSNFGDAEEIVDFEGNKVASWKNSVRNLFDTTRLKSEMPSVYLQFLKTSQFRRLTI